MQTFECACINAFIYMPAQTAIRSAEQSTHTHTDLGAKYQPKLAAATSRRIHKMQLLIVCVYIHICVCVYVRVYMHVCMAHMCVYVYNIYQQKDTCISMQMFVKNIQHKLYI